MVGYASADYRDARYLSVEGDALRVHLAAHFAADLAGDFEVRLFDEEADVVDASAHVVLNYHLRADAFFREVREKTRRDAGDVGNSQQHDLRRLHVMDDGLYDKSLRYGIAHYPCALLFYKA